MTNIDHFSFCSLTVIAKSLFATGNLNHKKEEMVRIGFISFLSRNSNPRSENPARVLNPGRFGSVTARDFGKRSLFFTL